MCTSKVFANRYLLWFANEHLDFRYHEIHSLLSLFNIHMKCIEKSDVLPYWIIELPSDTAACQIASRSVSLRFCIELWAQATSKEDLHKTLRAVPENAIKEKVNPEASFKINVETFCNRQSQEEKVLKIESFSYLPIDGPVKLKDPDVTLQYIEFYGLDSNTTPDEPLALFFGRWITDGQRDLISKLSLKRRKFIGNTTMDPQLSLLMANQAQVQLGDIVLDPFVGTGSLLVAAAHFGGYVLGTDIDFMMLHAKTRPSRIQKKKQRDIDESIRSNILQYGNGSRYLDVLVADTSLPLWRSTLKLDAIITDPPYGIRESTERLGSSSAKKQEIPEEYIEKHIPSKVEYGLHQLYQDLLHFGAQHLTIGGRLVCWIPIVRKEYSESLLPSHPSFTIVGNSEQILNSFTGRRLLTFEKKHEPENLRHVSEGAVMENFRPKFFRCGEDIRKERKLRKAMQANGHSVPSGEEWSSTQQK